MQQLEARKRVNLQKYHTNLCANPAFLLESNQLYMWSKADSVFSQGTLLLAGLDLFCIAVVSTSSKHESNK